jgi:predicted house-cleaning noncanonical NTP pyrophosphatase (MazG superfamily)
MVDLDPEVQHFRDRRFLDKIALWATKNSVSIRMRGSLLSHAYYQLESAGVSVVCVDPLEGDVEVAEFNKLVRDDVPRSIQERGEAASVRRMAGKELETALRSKLIEEAIEVSRASNYEDLVGEIADLQEVLSAIKKHIAISNEHVRQEQEKKRMKRGGFASGVMLIRTESQPVIQPADPSPQRSLLGDTDILRTSSPERSGRESAVRQVIPFSASGSYFTTTVGGQQYRLRAVLAAHGIEVEIVPTESADQLTLFGRPSG